MEGERKKRKSVEQQQQNIYIKRKGLNTQFGTAQSTEQYYWGVKRKKRKERGIFPLPHFPFFSSSALKKNCSHPILLLSYFLLYLGKRGFLFLQTFSLLLATLRVSRIMSDIRRRRKEEEAKPLFFASVLFQGSVGQAQKFANIVGLPQPFYVDDRKNLHSFLKQYNNSICNFSVDIWRYFLPPPPAYLQQR